MACQAGSFTSEPQSSTQPSPSPPHQAAFFVGGNNSRIYNLPDGANLPVFLSANNLKPFISMDLGAALSAMIPQVRPILCACSRLHLL
jgi:hypothetical protein